MADHKNSRSGTQTAFDLARLAKALVRIAKAAAAAGLKGAAVGGAEVSTKHAGFIINKNHATFSDVVELIGVVQDTVYRTFGVELEPEVRIIE